MFNLDVNIPALSFVSTSMATCVQDMWAYSEEDREMMMDSFGSVGDSMLLEVALQSHLRGTMLVSFEMIGFLCFSGKIW